jgi:heme/copper-type cytochrome/quinol oxidase subunit 2
MKGTIVVVTQAEYDAWYATQKAAYLTAFPGLDPANQKPAGADSAKANPTAQLKP